MKIKKMLKNDYVRVIANCFFYHQFSMEVRGILLWMVMIMLSKIFYKKLRKKNVFSVGGRGNDTS